MSCHRHSGCESRVAIPTHTADWSVGRCRFRFQLARGRREKSDACWNMSNRSFLPSFLPTVCKPGPQLLLLSEWPAMYDARWTLSPVHRFILIYWCQHIPGLVLSMIHACILPSVRICLSNPLPLNRGWVAWMDGRYRLLRVSLKDTAPGNVWKTR